MHEDRRDQRGKARGKGKHMHSKILRSYIANI